MASETVTGVPQRPAEGPGPRGVARWTSRTGRGGDRSTRAESVAPESGGAAGGGGAGAVAPDAADVSVSASSRGSDKPGGAGAPDGTGGAGDTEGAGGPGGISPGSEPGRSGNAASRAALTVARSIGRDFRTVFSRPIRLLRERKLMAIPGTVVCVAFIALFALLQHFPGGLTLMLDVAGVHQAEPLWEVLLQLPLSMFAPPPRCSRPGARCSRSRWPSASRSAGWAGAA